ncbi:VHS-domain-containing protein [Stereum hirsutum FP-91666 SS1]|uniref:VHS-domain-containing protein n=1 Tax=Stereum hirsutum (strain FP-91666) TaxID=721885 RepID=R7RXN4_STEHR|nr:VHS-domain-containing protein [Stereum hirsutum FP-91666 SS1]EIM79650.1 VHS-domain-containing protein [Stereum hirsutum FP-91666 SS1]
MALFSSGPGSPGANWLRASPLEILITRATTASMPEPNYAIHLEVAEYINQKKANTPREAAMLIARLVNHRNPHIAMLTLALLDTLVQSCGYPFHLQIATKEFLNELVRRFPERPPPFPGPVMSRILELIHTWKEGICTDSRWKDDLGNIRDMHRLLTFKGYRFRDMPRGNRNETAVATSNLKSAEELEEEDREAQSAKLQELIRRGTPRDLAAAQELMKTLAGANPEAKPDYRTQALTELNKLEQKVILLNEILDNVDPERGEAFAKGDVYDQVASILISSRPKIQKWISDAESEDPESLDTYLQINDQINSVLNRYESYQKGDFTAAANPIPAELAGSSVQNDLSLIDFDDAPTPPPTSSQSHSNNGNGTPADDLAGLFSVSGSAPVHGYGHGQGAGSNGNGNGNGIASIMSQFNAAPAQQSKSYFQQPQQQQQQAQHPGTRAGMGMGMGSHPSFGGVGIGGAMGSVQPQYSGGMGGMGGMGMGAASGSGSGTTSPQSQSRPSSQFGQIMLPSTPKPMSPVGTGTGGGMAGTGGMQGGPQHPQQQQGQQPQGKDPFADLAGLF